MTKEDLGSTYSKVVELDLGSTLSLTLRENPSTGYRWVIVDQDLKASGIDNVVKLVNETYVPTKTKSLMVGSGGIKTL